VPHRKLEHPVEPHLPAAGVPPIDPEHELVQVVVQMGEVVCTLVGAHNPPLGQRCNSMHGGQKLCSLRIASKPGRALTARFMGVAPSVKPTVAFPAARDDRGAWLSM
jgi:hypothetical protein